MSKSRGKTEIPIERIAKELARGIDGADKVRADALQELDRFSDARACGLMRELARLSARLGADHPRVLKLGGRIESERTLRLQLRLETARARTPEPSRDPAACTLHGHVYHKLLPVPGLAAALLDVKTKRCAQEFGFSATDDTGYFRIECPGGADGSFVIGLFKQDQLIYIDDCPFALQDGEAHYREIMLASLDPVNKPPCPGDEEEPPRIDSLALLAKQDQEGNYLVESGKPVTGSVKLNKAASKLTIVSLFVPPTHREVISAEPTQLEFQPGSQEASFKLTTHPVQESRSAEIQANLEKESKSIRMKLLSRSP